MYSFKAAESVHFCTADFFVRNGANVNTPKGDTSIKMACRYGYLKIVKYLVSIGAVVYPSLLLEAIKTKNKSVLHYLMNDLHLQFPTEEEERAECFKEIVLSDQMDLLEAFLKEDDKFVLDINDDPLKSLVEKMNEELILQILDLDSVTFPNEQAPFFLKARFQTLKRMFDKGLKRVISSLKATKILFLQ